MSARDGRIWDALADEAVALVEGLRRSVVLVHARRGHGSGTIWESDGLIVTNHHVLDSDRAEIELSDGRRLTGSVAARDPHNDLAALRVPARDLPAAPIGDSTALRVGELVLAVGNPLGVRGTATLGIVNAVAAAGAERRGREVLQADVALGPGSSGGPLADITGRVVGIAAMVIHPGIAVAVPSHVVRRFVASLSGERPRLGVTTQPVLLPPAVAAGGYAGARHGLMLLEIEEGSPAESAGLLPGDVLLALDGRPIRGAFDLPEHLMGSRRGEPLRLTLLRAGAIEQRAVCFGGESL